MRVLVVYCHPDPESFCAAARDVAVAALGRAGHETRLLDLYATEFQPVLTRAERRAYYDEAANQEPVRAHLDLLRWAQALVFVYPTWWYGQPAMLKGWLDRVFVPGAAFRMPKGGEMIGPLLSDLRLVAAVTTLGSPRWWWWRMWRPGQHALLTGMALLGAPRCRKLWIALYDMDHAGPAQRARFLKAVSRKLGAIPP